MCMGKEVRSEGEAGEAEEERRKIQGVG
jgi:hypothetical protein